jgi:hypothetical protein
MLQEFLVEAPDIDEGDLDTGDDDSDASLGRATDAGQAAELAQVGRALCSSFPHDATRCQCSVGQHTADHRRVVFTLQTVVFIWNHVPYCDVLSSSETGLWMWLGDLSSAAMAQAHMW